MTTRKLVMFMALCAALGAAVSLWCNLATDPGPKKVDRVEVDHRLFSDGTKIYMPDGTVLVTYNSGNFRLDVVHKQNADGEEARVSHKMFYEDKLLLSAKFDDTGSNELLVERYDENLGHLWQVEDHRDPQGFVTKRLAADGKVTALRVQRPDKTQESFAYSDGKMVQRCYEAAGLHYMVTYTKDEKLHRRRAYMPEGRLVDTFFDHLGNASHRQIWVVNGAVYEATHELERLEVLDRQGQVLKKAFSDKHDKAREVYSRLDDGTWRVVYYGINGKAVAAAIQSEAGAVLRSDDASNEPTAEEAIPSATLRNEDEQHLHSGWIYN